jgi:cation:H+ antiporter
MILAFSAIAFGIALMWTSAEKLEKYSVLSAKKFGLSPFFIGSTVIAFGTSAPEMLTTFFVSLENKGAMVIGNVVGSNVANLSLVFGSMLLILAYKKLNISQDKSILINLVILLASSLLVWFLIATNPFSIYTSAILLCCLISVILFWYKNSNAEEIDSSVTVEKNVFLKLLLSLVVLVFAAWLITHGANLILDQYNLGQLFIGYTVLAIGTSLPEIAASVSLALKGRYETVSGTLIGSNIFNGLCVLAIPGLFMRPEMSSGWSYSEWSPLLFLLFLVTLLFAFYIFMLSRKEQKAGFFLSFIFLSSYFFSLYYAF